MKSQPIIFANREVFMKAFMSNAINNDHARKVLKVYQANEGRFWSLEIHFDLNDPMAIGRIVIICARIFRVPDGFAVMIEGEREGFRHTDCPLEFLDQSALFVVDRLWRSVVEQRHANNGPEGKMLFDAFADTSVEPGTEDKSEGDDTYFY